MAAKKFTKADIIDAVYDRTGVSRKEISAVMDLVLSEIKAALLDQCVIELRGFGTFEVKMRKARLRARNPRTGEIISIRSHGNVAFRPGRELKQDVWSITDEDPVS